MPSLMIREIRKEDNASMAAVIRSVLVEMGAPKQGTAYADKSLDMMFETYQAERCCYYVVTDGERVLGGGGIAPLENGPEHVCEFQKMYFLPEARGKGLGKALLEQSLKQAVDFGFSQSYIETLPSMQAAQKLYKACGFEYLDGPMGGTGHTSCTVWMLKDLGDDTAGN